MQDRRRLVLAAVFCLLPASLAAQVPLPADPPAGSPAGLVSAGSRATTAPATFPETEEFLQQGSFPEETADADADGVPDIDDNCPATPAEQSTPVGILPVQVDECGCPKDPCTCDGDADGVPDCHDRCPATRLGEWIDGEGCTLPLAETHRQELQVHFEFGEHELLPQAKPLLLAVRERLLASPNLQVRLEGHADWKGPQTVNQPLSERRAQACREFVLHGTTLAPSRVQAVGYGELRPLADNRTEEGRIKNRRVTAVFSDIRAAREDPPGARPSAVDPEAGALAVP